MLLEVYALVWISALYLTSKWAFSTAPRERWAEQVPIASITSAGLWAFLSVQGTIDLFGGWGEGAQTVQAGPVQWVTAGLFILSLGAFVLWMYDSYPPEVTT